MYPRQHWLFTVGCWVAIATAALHLVGQFAGQPEPASDAERQWRTLSTTVQFAFPGGTARSPQDLATGFGLTFSVLMAGLGVAGLMVARRAATLDAVLFGVARTFAVVGAAMMTLSLVYFFIIPTMCLALFTMCFALASVTPPAPHRE